MIDRFAGSYAVLVSWEHATAARNVIHASAAAQIELFVGSCLLGMPSVLQGASVSPYYYGKPSRRGRSCNEMALE